MYFLFCATFTGYQSGRGLTTRFQPCASTLSPTLLLSISLSFYPSTPLPDTSVHPRTQAPSVFFSSKLSHPVKEHSPSQGQLNGIYCLMNSDTPNLLLHLKQLPKPISSDLPTNNNGSEQTFFTRACFSVTGCQGHANHFYSKCCWLQFQSPCC